MKYFWFFLFAAFWIPNEGSEYIIQDLLDLFLTHIFSEGLSIPKIEMGDGNELSNVTVSVSKDSRKEIGGEYWGLDIDLMITQLQITGNYHFEKIQIGDLFTLFGDGKFSLDLRNLTFKFIVKATDQENVNVTNIFADIQKSHVMFENLFNDPSVADFVCEILSNTIPDLVKSIFDESIIDHVKLIAEGIYKELIKNLQENSTNVMKFRQLNFNEIIKKILKLKK